LRDDDGGDDFGESCCAQSTELNAINKYNNEQRRIVSILTLDTHLGSATTAKKNTGRSGGGFERPVGEVLQGEEEKLNLALTWTRGYRSSLA
jgi:hypothetical protein